MTGTFLRRVLPAVAPSALHFALALAFAIITPYSQPGRLLSMGRTPVDDIGAPDERAHVLYVRHLAEGRGIPVFDPSDRVRYEDHQPPLYYLLAAGWSKTTAADDFDSPSTGIRLRALNAVIGAIGVAGVYFLGLWGFRRRDVAFLSAGFAGLLPMNLALSGAVSNDPLMICLGTWALALGARGIREGWNPKLAAATGVVCGAAILAKTNAIGLLASLPFAFVSKSADGKSRVMLSACVIFLAAAVLVALPWWIRNALVVGDPLGMKVFVESFSDPNRSDLATNFIRELGAFGYWTGINDYGLGVGWWLLRSLLGVFGYMDIFLPKPLYPIFLVLVAVLIVARIAASKEPHVKDSWGVRLMCGVYFAVVLAFFVRFNATYFQAQARYLLPAIGPMCLTSAIGAVYLSRYWKWIPGLLLATMLSLDLWIVSWLPGQFAIRKTEPALARTLELGDRHRL